MRVGRRTSEETALYQSCLRSRHAPLRVVRWRDFKQERFVGFNEAIALQELRRFIARDAFDNFVA